METTEIESTPKDISVFQSFADYQKELREIWADCTPRFKMGIYIKK